MNNEGKGSDANIVGHLLVFEGMKAISRPVQRDLRLFLKGPFPSKKKSLVTLLVTTHNYKCSLHVYVLVLTYYITGASRSEPHTYHSYDKIAVPVYVCMYVYVYVCM